jgi:hypothetical protein
MAFIHTERLLLRPYQPGDWEDFQALVQNDELMSPLTGPLSR